MEDKRLDQYVNETFQTGREKAKELIKNEKVVVDGKIITKPSFLVLDNFNVQIIEDDYNKYVSRGAFKLLQAIEKFDINLENKKCIDVGSSTGGFSDVMLQNGAKSVLAVDTGTDQLHEKILSNDKVTSRENTNILEIFEKDYGKFEFATIDVSFVSIKKIIPHVTTLLENGATCVFLIKPQFEVGKKGLSKKGVVKDLKDRENVVLEIVALCENVGFTDIYTIKSDTVGHAGNVEYLCYLKFGG